MAPVCRQVREGRRRSTPKSDKAVLPSVRCQKPPRTLWSRTRNLPRSRSMASRAIEIARREGTEFRSVYLSLEDDGTIKMDAQDIGPTVTEHWGDDDYEFWVRVPPASVPKLA